MSQNQTPAPKPEIRKSFSRRELITEATDWMRGQSVFGHREDYHRDLGLLVDFITDLIPENE